MFKKILLTAVASLAISASSQALTIDFDSPLPAGVVLGTQTGDSYIVTDQSLGSFYAPPSPQSGNYYATYNANNPYAPSTSTISLGGVYKSGSFTWGSVDGYNTLQLLLNGVVQRTITGDQVLNPANGNQGQSGTITYSFAPGAAFDSIKFSTGTNAFEVDNIKLSTSVPDGGTTAVLLGLAMISLVAIRSKLSVA